MYSILAIALFLAVAAPGANSQRIACNCGGPETADPVCGYDGQTYGNECILKCANIEMAYKGKCDNKGCWPWGESQCNGDFDDHTPFCAIGLTFDGAAEAQCSGTGATGAKCGSPGVCRYRADGQPNFLPTTGGKGIDIKQVVANTTLPDRNTAPYAYSEALSKLLLFYDSMISGNITAACRRRLTWRSDSCSGCIGKYGEDLSGGYYEAGGSTLKYPATISGFSSTMLAWAGVEYGDVITRAGAMDDLKWKVKWAADHVIAAHPQEKVFASFIGNSTDDFDYFGPVEYYEDFKPNKIYGYVDEENPGAEILADAAATLASAVTLFSNGTAPPGADDAWKASAMEHARQLYDFAKENPISYMDSEDPGTQQLAEMYASYNGVYDDLTWAAMWMYKATGEEQYLDDAKEFFAKAPPLSKDEAAQFEVGFKTPAAAILLAQTGDADALKTSETYFDPYLTLKATHTVAGAAYDSHWGAMRDVGNLGFLTMVHQKNEGVDDDLRAKLVNYGMHQTNYILGDAGRSWVVGFGKDYPTYVNHKFSHNSILTWKKEGEPLAEKMWMTDTDGPWASEHKDFYIQKGKFDYEGSTETQAHTAWGLLFGAPLQDDGLINSRRDYTYAEPTVEYNAGAFGAAAALADWYGTPAYTEIETLDGVTPFNCAVAPAPAPAPLPVPALAPAPLEALAPAPTVLNPVEVTPTAPIIPVVDGGNSGGDVSTNSVPPNSQAFSFTTTVGALTLLLAVAVPALFL